MGELEWVRMGLRKIELTASENVVWFAWLGTMTTHLVGRFRQAVGGREKRFGGVIGWCDWAEEAVQQRVEVSGVV